MLLNKNWTIKRKDTGSLYKCRCFPVSMYQTLIANGKIDNIYYGENEWHARELSRNDCDFCCSFVPDANVLCSDKIFLRFNGIDTLSEIYLNGILLGSTDNMFRKYEFEVKDKLKAGENELRVAIKSPINYVEAAQKKRKVWSLWGSIDGFAQLRKAHYMFGWDWGPQVPDMGIWRDVELVGRSIAEVEGFYCTQRFSADYSELTLTVKPELRLYKVRPLTQMTEITLSDGRKLCTRTALDRGEKVIFSIKNPPLWFPRGYGKQPLQKISVTLFDGEDKISEHSEMIGFRTLTVKNEADKFCFSCNGIDIFAMGANYIPQDQILPYLTDERTAALLDQCEAANYNTLRIWGGGLYADDFMLNECDRRGIIIWQDFMFACSVYYLNAEFESTVKAELEDNIKRMRNHACIGLWCGNNEIESMWEGWGVKDDECQEHYVKIFEQTIPTMLKKLDSERFYWPSSPSSGGNQYGGEVFNGSSSSAVGDQHYWDIWHNFKPLEEFRKHLFPFCSEYGFESIPCMKTIMSFAKSDDLNLCSPVMECHQKCERGNEKLLYYIAQMCCYPYNFNLLIYASQLVQSDAIRSDVEHMRRNRGRCMGSLYWQVNDSNPVISWSSVDYFGRWKALHYAAKRFYAPVLLSCLEEDISAVKLNIANETTQAARGEIKWNLHSSDAETIDSGSAQYNVPPLSSLDVITLNLTENLKTLLQKRSVYLEFCALENGRTISRGSTIFVRPKSFEFLPPNIEYKLNETLDSFTLEFTAKAFAKSVYLDLSECDCQFSDNWFDIHGSQPVEITIEKKTLSKPLTADELKAQLQIISCFDLQ